MAHECFLCGEYCYCDLDDIDMPQPADCPHVCEPEPDDCTLAEVLAEDEADRERYEIEKGIPPRDGDGNYRSRR